MVKKNLKNTITIIIDKDMAAAIGLETEADATAFILNDVLIIKSKHRKPDEEAKKALTESLMDKYEDVLKKLAKT